MRQLASLFAVAVVSFPLLAQTSWGRGTYGQSRQPDAVERALEGWAQRAHEKELARQHQENERQMGAAPSIDKIISTLNSPKSYTRGQANGHAWRGLDDFLRVFYVNAARDGASATSESASFSCLCTPPDVVDGVSSFYDETGRLAVPIARVVKLVVLRSAGAPDVMAQVRNTIQEFSTWQE